MDKQPKQPMTNQSRQAGGTAWEPSWWSNERHGSAWERTKEAMKRDWEQTKADMGGKGRELDQDVDDTVKQAAGKDVIPPRNVANRPGGTPSWDEAQHPMRFGVGAFEQYGKEHPKWNDKLEKQLATDWDSGGSSKLGRAWNDVKDAVRRAYEKVTH